MRIIKINIYLIFLWVKTSITYISMFLIMLVKTHESVSLVFFTQFYSVFSIPDWSLFDFCNIHPSPHLSFFPYFPISPFLPTISFEAHGFGFGFLTSLRVLGMVKNIKNSRHTGNYYYQLALCGLPLFLATVSSKSLTSIDTDLAWGVCLRTHTCTCAHTTYIYTHTHTPHFPWPCKL